MKIKMGEVKYSMKARVKILVNGAAATLLTGAVAAGLILSSTGALQTKNNDVLDVYKRQSQDILSSFEA